VKAKIVVITDELRTVVVDDPYKQRQDGQNTSTWTSIGPGGASSTIRSASTGTALLNTRNPDFPPTK